MSWIQSIAQAAAAVGGGIMGSRAANNAAGAEQEGAQQAEQTIQSNQTAANQAEQTALANIGVAENPYLSVGSTAAPELSALISKGFTAPTLAEAENTPGYQFELQQGTDAITKNAAATGNLMSGTTGTALEQFGEGLASTNYEQAYNNALNSYLANYQTLLGGTNVGSGATNTMAGANLGVANSTANIDLTSAQEIAQQQNNAAAARAQAALGSAAAWTGMMNGIANAAPGNMNFGGGGGANSAGSSTPGGVPSFGS